MTRKQICLIIAAVWLVGIVGLIVTLGGCSSDLAVEPGEEATGTITIPLYEDVDYSMVKIEGMYCLVFDGVKKFAVTCDWRGRTIVR